MEKNNKDEDAQSSLEDFFGSDSRSSDSAKKQEKSSPADTPKDPKPVKKKSDSLNASDTSGFEDMDFDELEEIRDSVYSAPTTSRTHPAGHRETPRNLGPSYLLSVDYEGYLKKAVIRLYDPASKTIQLWYDNTGHKPYLYTDFPSQVVQNKVGNHRGYFGSKDVELRDLLRDTSRKMTKVMANDPLSIGGGQGAIRDMLVEHTPDMQTISHAWEAAIRYRNCYTYDLNLVPGLPYKIENGNLVRCEPDVDSVTLNQFKKTIGDVKGLERIVQLYAPMFFTGVPDIKRIAIDIEVHAPVANRIPDPQLAEQQVTAIGLTDNESLNKCFVLRRDGHPEGEKGSNFPKELEPPGAIVYFDSEAEMLLQAFRVIDKYPIVLTFVGDTFDLNYLYHRAERLKIDLNNDCPIRLGRDIAIMRGGIHVDLYRFLKNPSIRLYALSGAYERSSLDAIGQGLLGIGKLDLSTSINDLPYNELAHYCWLDSKITMEITQFEENLLLRLIILLMRISRLSMEDVTRFGISSWIQSLFRQEHRSRNIIIPQQQEIELLKTSAAQTEAMIKDKAFKGAIVIEPKAGVHFNATVLDFASLYPTIMKTHNISYETVDCPHEECKNATDNRVPETDHWTCKVNRGMISETIGFFRDTRVNWFKGKSKDKSLDKGIRNWYTVVEKALKVFVNACLPFHEEVLIRNSDAIISKRAIGTLEDNWKDYEILSIDNEWGSPTFGQSVFVPIVGFQNSGKAPILNIQLRDGRNLRCTPNHVLPKLLPKHERDNREAICKKPLKLEYTAAEDLQIDDELLIHERIPLSSSPPEKLFIPDIIPVESIHIGINRSDYSKFSYRKTQKTDNPLISIINQEFRYSKVSKCYRAKWDNLSEKAKKMIRLHASANIPVYIKLVDTNERWREAGKWQNIIVDLDSDFFSLMGWYLSEGHAGVNRVSISQCKQANPAHFSEIGSLLKKMSLPYAIYSEKDYVIHSKVLSALLETLCGKGSEHKRIPLHLLDKSRARALLDTFFKGDGNFNRRGEKRYSSSSRQLAYDILMLLGALGIHASLHHEEDMYRIVETKGLKYKRYGRGLVDFNGTHPVRIRSIEKSENTEETFDLETKNGLFVGTNGIVVHNSYGVTGAQHFELFCMPAAESVTAYGRNAIMRLKEKAESMGVQVLYGDTDSVFLDNPSKDQQDEMIAWSRKELGIDLEAEKTYKYVALSDRKKNYIGVYDSGYVEVKGLSGKKRNTPLFVQNAFREMLEVLAKVDNTEGFEIARDEIRKIVFRVIDRLEGKAEAYAPDELAFRVQLTKSLESYGDVQPQHVRAAKMCEEEVGAGSIIEYIKTKDGEGVLPVSIAKKQSYWIDKEKYIDTLKSVFGQVLDAVGLDFEGLMGFTTLDQFF
ncbi:MAG: DNA polymerase domain-containing protein [Candidatus Thorarchaeota archaeon]|nr:DNA polymerase domain-containing protein [Candidatus Thorarchaeota archaeon]